MNGAASCGRPSLNGLDDRLATPLRLPHPTPRRRRPPDRDRPRCEPARRGRRTVARHPTRELGPADRRAAAPTRRARREEGPRARRTAAKAVAVPGPRAGGAAFQKDLQALQREGQLPVRAVIKRLHDGSKHRTGIWTGNQKARRDKPQRRAVRRPRSVGHRLGMSRGGASGENVPWSLWANADPPPPCRPTIFREPGLGS